MIGRYLNTRITARLDERTREARLNEEIGDAFFLQGQYEQALRAYAKARRFFASKVHQTYGKKFQPLSAKMRVKASAGLRMKYALCLSNLGSRAAAAGECGKALSLLERHGLRETNEYRFLSRLQADELHAEPAGC